MGEKQKYERSIQAGLITHLAPYDRLLLLLQRVAIAHERHLNLLLRDHLRAHLVVLPLQSLTHRRILSQFCPENMSVIWCEMVAVGIFEVSMPSLPRRGQLAPSDI
jgi:hypothetical protein